MTAACARPYESFMHRRTLCEEKKDPVCYWLRLELSAENVFASPTPQPGIRVGISWQSASIVPLVSGSNIDFA